MSASLREPLNLNTEFLDFERLDEPDYKKTWMDLLRLKYGEYEQDIVIPVHDSAAQDLVLHRRELFPNTAFVVCSITESLRERLAPAAWLTGVVYRLEFQRTLDCIKSLLPAVRKVVVISGVGKSDVQAEAGARQAYAHERDVRFAYWTGIPVEEMQEAVSHLSGDTAILFLVFDRDREGRFSPSSSEVVKSLVSTSSVPIFSIIDSHMGQGIVGGCLASAESQGKRAGEIATRVLRGEQPGSIPFSGLELNQYVFDWRQLRRWGIHERDLPNGSLVLFREATAWERYWRYVTGAVAAVALQSLLIGVLLVNRNRRLRAESRLAERLAFESLLSDISGRFVHITPDKAHREIECALACVSEYLSLDRGTIFEVSEDSQQLKATARWVRSGQPPAPVTLTLASISWLWARLQQEDVVSFRSLADLPETAAAERELMRKFGLRAGVAIALRAKSTVLGLLALGLLTREQSWDDTIVQRLKQIGQVFADALAHAHADAALNTSRSEARALAGRLLTAQEDERKRLAREMHDDICQRLAASAIEAGNLEQQLSDAESAQKTAACLKNHLIGLSDDIHCVSRQLHPTILDDLGLEEAIRAECHRLAEREGIGVQFHGGGLPDRPPPDIALCVYRVAQEALRNAVRHGKCERVELTLRADPEFLYLEVRDLGCGFRVEDTRGKPGLGLISMKERAHLVGGEISISSLPGQGTSIALRAPLPEETS